jgi:hypothetical protein
MEMLRYVLRLVTYIRCESLSAIPGAIKPAGLLSVTTLEHSLIMAFGPVADT